MPLFHDPNTAIVALLLGLLGILFEFHAPGSIFPGVAGAALVLLSAVALSRFPLSPGAVTLVAIAALLLLLELKVHSAGVLATVAAVLLAAGIYLLIDSPDPQLHIRPATAFAFALPVFLLTAFLLTIASRASANKAVTGSGQMIGAVGIVIAAQDGSSPLRVQIAGEYWNALASCELVSPDLLPGSPVRVTAIRGLQLTVQPLHDTIRTI